MRRGPARNRWLGWMALVAVWLTALAPTVSRTVPAGFAFPDLGAWCESAPASHPDTAGGHHDADAACGYCTLFAHTPGLGGSFFIGHALPPSGHVSADLPPAPTVAAAVRAHAPPRGPPVATHA